MFDIRKKTKNLFSKKSESVPNILPKDIKVKNNVDSLSIKKDDKKFYDDYIKRKKEVLPKNALTREEFYKEIEKQFQSKSFRDSNPFKTREDMYYLFYNGNMSLNRQPVPFEEVRVGGKPFYIHKKFENSRIVIEMMFSAPDIEINLKDEYARKETTKNRLEKINNEMLYIQNQIAGGDERYKLLDIGDLEEEKLRLERILESIKYGKSAIFIFEDPITMKKAYMLRYCNGEYKYLKVTENNYITEENNVRSLKVFETQKKLEDITNYRILKNWKEILGFIAVFFIIVITIILLVKLAMFEEEMFDERVEEYIGGMEERYQKEIEYWQGQARKNFDDADSPKYKQQI